MGIEYGNLIKRTHRTLGTYLVLWARLKRADCVVVEGEELRAYLGEISRLEEVRMEALALDLDPFFPHWRPLPAERGGTPMLCFSTRPIPDAACGRGWAWCKGALRELGIAANRVKLPSENEIVAHLAQVVCGLCAFRSLAEHESLFFEGNTSAG